MKSLSDFNKKNIALLFGLSVAAAFFVVYAFLPLAVPGIYNSPDENSNAVFATEMAEHGRLHLVEPLNLVLDDRVHPRSVRVVDDLQVPGGFLGLPILYGLLAKVFGNGSLGFLTPLMAILGALAWGLLLGHHFNRRLGWLAALLLLLMPTWWYWSSRTMMPNVPLVTLSLWGVYFLTAAPISRYFDQRDYEGLGLLRRADGALAGIFLALALAVRLSAAYWFILAAVVSVIMLRRQLPWGRLVMTAVFLFFALSPFLAMNQSLYGNFLATGYGDVAAAIAPNEIEGPVSRLLGPLRPLLFPFGFSTTIAVNNFIVYGVGYFWWWSVAVVAAAAFLIGQRRRRSGIPAAARPLAAVMLTISVWLIYFYGSWQVPDSPGSSLVSIGSSYFRYWLPICVFSTWPLAAALDHLSRRQNWQRFVVPVVVVVLATWSAVTVFGAPQEGLSKVRFDLEQYRTERAAVLSATEDDAIVVVDHADKYLFPQRAVIYPLRSDSTYELLPDAVANRPTYYFGLTLPLRDLTWLQTDKLPPAGLSIEPVESVGDKTLYRIILQPNE
jgi:hypothetical protein